MVGLANFDHSKYGDMKERQSFEAFPEGDYPAIIIKSEMRENNSGDGQHLSLEFVVTGNNEAKGRKFWANINLVHSSKQTTDIACEELATICRATGVLNPPNSEALHGAPMMVRIIVDEYEDRNGKTQTVNKPAMYFRLPDHASTDYANGAVPESQLPPAVGQVKAPVTKEIPF